MRFSCVNTQGERTKGMMRFNWHEIKFGMITSSSFNEYQINFSLIIIRNHSIDSKIGTDVTYHACLVHHMFQMSSLLCLFLVDLWDHFGIFVIMFAHFFFLFLCILSNLRTWSYGYVNTGFSILTRKEGKQILNLKWVNIIPYLIDTYRIMWKAVFDECRMYGLDEVLFYLSRLLGIWGQKPKKIDSFLVLIKRKRNPILNTKKRTR